jgi:colanic acid/amylovoran biosynthesis protein
MNVFIEEVGSTNKGAFLMYLAIQQQIEAKFDTPKIIVDDKRFTKIEEAEHNFYKVAHFQRFKIKLHKIIDSTQLAKYNLVKFDDIKLVLNSGGYANGDFWYKAFGKKRFIEKLDRYKHFKKNDVPIILLPQAFDTFTSDFIKSYIVKVHDLADLIYARDQISLDNLQSVLGKSEKVKLAPDFTNLIEVTHTGLIDGEYVSIIPNAKMIQAGVISRNDYIESLLIIVNTVHSKGYEIVFLNHEGIEDEKLILEVTGKVNFDSIVLTNLDALEIKSVIRDSNMVITGRYHGLVSSLSQGVPVLATSWSHKYKELLADYNAENQLLDINNKAGLVKKLNENLQLENMKDLRNLLEDNSKLQKNKAKEMWHEIFKKIEN